MTFVRINNFGFSLYVANGSKSDVSFCDGGCLAIIDSSASSIMGPPEDIERINGILKAKSFLFGRYAVSYYFQYSFLLHVFLKE